MDAPAPKLRPQAVRCEGDLGAQALHAHEAMEMFAVVRGRSRLRAGGRRRDVGPGEMGVVPPWETHGGAPLTPDFVVEALSVSTEWLSEAGIRGEGLGEPSPPAARRFRTLFRGVRLGASALAVDAALVELCGLLAPAAPRRDPALVARARAVLRERFAEDLSLADLAAEVGVSPAYLCRAYRAATGLPPQATRNAFRVARAETLVRRGWPAGRAAVEVGFCDQSHLARNYRRLLGHPTRGSISSNLRTDGGE